jgi:hypothetical protein
MFGNRYESCSSCGTRCDKIKKKSIRLVNESYDLPAFNSSVAKTTTEAIQLGIFCFRLLSC